MITLVDPSPELRASWQESVAEFDGERTHGYGIDRIDPQDLAKDEVFADWLAAQRRMATAPPEGYVPGNIFWIVDDAEPERVLGSLSLRHELNDFLLAEGGHIGYGVRPSARGRGVATAALRAALDRSRELGLDRVLVTCDDDNIASARTIERCGGVLEDVRGDKRRYWIELTSAS